MLGGSGGGRGVETEELEFPIPSGKREAMLTMTSFHSLSEQRQQSILSSFLHGSLPITQLKQDRTPLSGANAQALRSNFVTYSFHPADCTRFDLAAALLTANKDSLEIIWQQDNTHGQAKRVWEACTSTPYIPIAHYHHHQIEILPTLSLCSIYFN